MNSGIRDAHNLAWKLAAVVNGSLGEGVLDSYERERAPHAAALIQLAINIGRVMMPTSRLQAALVQSGFRAAGLLPPLHAYFAQMKYKPKPFWRRLPRARRSASPGRPPDPAAGPGDARPYGRSARRHRRRRLRAAGRGSGRTADRGTRKGGDLGLSGILRLAILPMRFNPDPNGPPDIPAGRDLDDSLAGAMPAGRDVLVLVRPDRYVAAAAAVSDDAEVASFAGAVRALVGEAKSGSEECLLRRL
jgi:3-(3-hydroxy-phenyl)propionate hydroxylase